MREVARNEAVVEYITIFEEAISAEKMVENIFTHFLTPSSSFFPVQLMCKSAGHHGYGDS